MLLIQTVSINNVPVCRLLYSTRTVSTVQEQYTSMSTCIVLYSYNNTVHNIEINYNYEDTPNDYYCNQSL